MRVGTTVDFPNNDRVFHNVFSFRDGKRFDLGMYPIGTLRRVTFDKPGLSRLFCNIHPNMAAYVWPSTRLISAWPTRRRVHHSGGSASDLHVSHLAPGGDDPDRHVSVDATSGSRSRSHEDGSGSRRRPDGVRFFESGACPAGHVEADLTGGVTSDKRGALATQVRAFGDVPLGLRVLAEAAWAARSETDESTDAFGAAYPYAAACRSSKPMPSGCFTRAGPSSDSAQGDIGRRSGSIRVAIRVLGISPRAADSIRRILRALQ